jgi:peptidoglycan hydrolase CwlO-like protein
MLTKMEKGHFEDKISTLEKQVEELTKELKEVRKEPKLVSIETYQANKIRLSLSC